MRNSFKQFTACLMMACLISACTYARGNAFDHDGNVRAAARTANGVIWILGSDGELLRMPSIDTSSFDVAERDVAEICADGTELRFLQAGPMGVWSLKSSSSQSPLISISKEDGQPLALVCSSHQSVIVTDKVIAVHEFSANKITPLSAPLYAGKYTAAIEGRNLLVGIDAGEWGGGLRKIDIDNGSVAEINDNHPDPCKALVNSLCRTVTSIIKDANNASCFVVASGLEHKYTSGRLVKLCENEFSILIELRRDRLNSVPFYHLIYASGKLHASSDKGVYTIQNEHASFEPFKNSVNIGKYNVSLMRDVAAIYPAGRDQFLNPVLVPR